MKAPVPQTLHFCPTLPKSWASLLRVESLEQQRKSRLPKEERDDLGSVEDSLEHLDRTNACAGGARGGSPERPDPKHP